MAQAFAIVLIWLRLKNPRTARTAKRLSRLFTSHFVGGHSVCFDGMILTWSVKNLIIHNIVEIRKKVKIRVLWIVVDSVVDIVKGAKLSAIMGRA